MQKANQFAATPTKFAPIPPLTSYQNVGAEGAAALPGFRPPTEFRESPKPDGFAPWRLSSGVARKGRARHPGETCTVEGGSRSKVAHGAVPTDAVAEKSCANYASGGVDRDTHFANANHRNIAEMDGAYGRPVLSRCNSGPLASSSRLLRIREAISKCNSVKHLRLLYRAEWKELLA